MVRSPRNPPGGYVYHVLNRANRRRTLFESDTDFHAFLRVVAEAQALLPMRLLHYTVMPNHWHFVLWPELDGQLAAFMHYLTTTHAARWNAFRGLVGTGHVYQGPYKFFGVQDDGHYLAVVRYVLRNALRAGLVDRAEAWRFCSLHPQQPLRLSPGPIPLPPDLVTWVNSPLTELELVALRRSVERGTPFGDADWQQACASALGLEHTLREPSRRSRHS